MLVNHDQVLKFLLARKIFLSVCLCVLGFIGLLRINNGCIPNNPAQTILIYYIVLPAIVAAPIAGAYLVLRYTKSPAAKYHRRFIWTGIIIWLSIIWFLVIYNHFNPFEGAMISNTEMNVPAK